MGRAFLLRESRLLGAASSPISANRIIPGLVAAGLGFGAGIAAQY